MNEFDDVTDDRSTWQRVVRLVQEDPDRADELATEVAAMLSPADVIDLRSGAPEFWTGLAKMMSGGGQRDCWASAGVPRLGVPGVRFVDGPRGVVLLGSTCFPSAMARGASWDVELEERVGDVIGVEVRSQGGDLFGGVCVNLLRHPGWGRAQETYGEDPFHVGVMGAAVVRGVQRHAMACVKHFALNSIENARFIVDVTVEADDLETIYLDQFRRIVDEGVAVVMTAYNSVNGEWCGQNRPLITDILKGRWGFDGFVMTDFIFGMRSAVEGVRAGQDLEMPFRNLFARELPGAIEAGDLSSDELVDGARRILLSQLRQAVRGEPERYRAEAVASAAHRALAREAASASLVLLENAATVAGAKVLPIDPASISSVAVIGELGAVANLGDRGSSNVVPPDAVSILDGLRSAAPDHLKVLHAGDDPVEGSALAARCDLAVVVVGCTYRDEGEWMGALATDPTLAELLPPRPERPAEVPVAGGAVQPPGPDDGGDRRDLNLSGSHRQLIDAVTSVGTSTVVVLMGGAAIITEPWNETAGAIVMAWYPGMEGGHAVADLIFGRRVPEGRLPFSWPGAGSNLPTFDPEGRTVHYDRDFGYRGHDRRGGQPAYPFGYGLGYTDVSYRSACLGGDGSGVCVEVELENLSELFEAVEVVQVYLHDPDQASNAKRLVGWARTRLDPGERCVVGIPIGAEIDRWIPHRLAGEAGVATLSVGPNAATQQFVLHVA